MEMTMLLCIHMETIIIVVVAVTLRLNKSYLLIKTLNMKPLIRLLITPLYIIGLLWLVIYSCGPSLIVLYYCWLFNIYYDADTFFNHSCIIIDWLNNINSKL